MSNNDYILNLLNIKDPNIFILNNSIKNKVIKGKNHKIIEAILSYIPSHCPCCGTINDSTNDIIKWGFRKNCKIKIPNISNCRSLLLLHKQRFYCKHCHNTFLAETNLVDKYKNISNNSELQIRVELTKKQSEKDIADRVNVSTSKINRVLNDISSKTLLRHPCLPINMNWDEFKSTNNMAFMIMDNDKRTIFDIKSSRKSIDLEHYFRIYQKRDRDKVQMISMDFYSGYIHLAKKLFRNANIVIDRYHIVTQVYNALNITRVKLCYKSNPYYNKLKHYWKLFLKNKNDLSDEKHYSKYFKKEISQKEIVTFLINTNQEFKRTYECYQGIINSIKHKDFTKFKNIIYNQDKYLPDKMKKALKLFRDNIKYIENSFKYDINNGVIEGTNNLIKSLKRIAFGYRKHTHYINRIFLIKGLIKG